MNSWIQIPGTAGNELNIGRYSSCRLINTAKIDEFFLDVSCEDKTGKIIALKNGKEEALCVADSEIVTEAWINLVKSIGVETVNFTERRRNRPMNYSFPSADEDDVMTILNTFLIITNAAAEADDRMERLERLFLSALIGYICSEAPEDEQNLESLNILLKAFEIREYDVNFENAVDLLFEDLEKKDSTRTELRNYKRFRRFSITAQKRALESCYKRMEVLGFEPRPKEDSEDGDSWEECSNWND